MNIEKIKQELETLKDQLKDINNRQRNALDLLVVRDGYNVIFKNYEGQTYKAPEKLLECIFDEIEKIRYLINAINFDTMEFENLVTSSTITAENN